MAVAANDDSALDVCSTCGYFYLVSHPEPHLKSDVSVVYTSNSLVRCANISTCSNTLLMIKYGKPLMKFEEG